MVPCMVRSNGKWEEGLVEHIDQDAMRPEREMAQAGAGRGTRGARPSAPDACCLVPDAFFP